MFCDGIEFYQSSSLALCQVWVASFVINCYILYVNVHVYIPKYKNVASLIK